MDFEDLKNPEPQEKLKAAKAPEDILALQQRIIDTIDGKYGIRIFPECEFV